MEEFAISLNPVSEGDAKKTWRQCLTKIKEKVTALSYNTWFLPIKPIDLIGSELKLEVPNEYFIEWIEQHYSDLLNEVITSVIGNDAKISYSILEKTEEPEKPQLRIEKIPSEPVEKISSAITKEEDEENNYISFLNPKYTFENFVKGENNQLARAAGLAVAENPGLTSFNPLFIYGDVGLGKTHLVQAIGNKIVENFPTKKVLYLSADTFTSEFIDAIRNDAGNEFANKYKKTDVLIIDDIQTLIGKEKTQDLFFQIFNILHQSGKQIVLSSDKAPKDLKGLNERLISRFQWGLTADIQPPDLETRIAILKNKMLNFGMELEEEILEFIALNITTNIRELEGCLIKLLANASLNGKEITFDLVKKTVREIATNRPNKISIEQITKTVCEFFDVAENKVREKNRKKEVVFARQVAMYLSKKLTNSSLKTIGLHFGGRDHSTVIHAFNTIEEMIKTDEKVADTIRTLKTRIEASV